METTKNISLEVRKLDFLKYLKTQGYDRRYIGTYRRGLTNAAGYAPLEDLVAKILTPLFVKKLGQYLRERFRKGSVQHALTAVRSFRKFLISIGSFDYQLPLSTTGYFREVEKKLYIYLTNERRYSGRYVKRNALEYTCFCTYLISVNKLDFSNVDQMDVFYHLANRKHTTSSAVTMRVLLKFLFREEYLPKNYSPLVLCPRPKANEVRKFLPAEDVEKLLSSIDRTSVDGKRDFAFFLLMARLGLRGIEILRLRLDDIDWFESSIFVRGKHDKDAEVPFSMEVGEALIDYIKHSPRADSEYVFVSVAAPYTGITYSQTFSRSLRKLYQKTGIKCPTTRTEINVFRHSLATNRLKAGDSILSVRETMRHDSVITTMIYAKYDLPSLSNLACEWPGAVS